MDQKQDAPRSPPNVSTISEDGDFKYSHTANIQGYEMGFVDRGRRPKFSAQELDALVAGIESHKDIILPQNGAAAYQGSLSSSSVRQNCWKEILANVNAVSEVTRSLPEVVKRWRYLKSRTRVKARRLTKWDKPLSDLQKRILDTVGDMENSLNGDKDQYDEDGWDEVYEIDVGDVEDESATVTEQSQQSSTRVYQNNGVRTSARHVAVDKPRIVTPSTVSGHFGNNDASHDVVYWNGVPVSDSPSGTQRVSQVMSSEGAPHIPDGHPSTNNQMGYQTTHRDRLSDKNNVNITVQSCTCHHDNPKKSIDEERLKIEKERLNVERQRLAIEQGRLQIERERMEILRERVKTDPQQGRQ